MRPPAKPRNTQLETLLGQPSLKREREASGRQASVITLATAVGLLVFLVASSPGGLSGTSGFVIGFGAVLGVAVMAGLLAAAAQSRQRRLAREEILSMLTAALIVDQQQRTSAGREGDEPTVISETCLREILDLLRSASRARPQ